MSTSKGASTGRGCAAGVGRSRGGGGEGEVEGADEGSAVAGTSTGTNAGAGAGGALWEEGQPEVDALARQQRGRDWSSEGLHCLHAAPPRTYTVQR